MKQQFLNLRRVMGALGAACFTLVLTGCESSRAVWLPAELVCVFNPENKVHYRAAERLLSDL